MSALFHRVQVEPLPITEDGNETPQKNHPATKECPCVWESCRCAVENPLACLPLGATDDEMATALGLTVH